MRRSLASLRVLWMICEYHSKAQYSRCKNSMLSGWIYNISPTRKSVKYQKHSKSINKSSYISVGRQLTISCNMTWHDLTTSKPCDVNAAVSSVWVSIDNWLESIMPDMSMTLSKPELSRQQKTTRIPHNSDFLTIWDTSNLSKCSQVVLDLAFVLWVYRHALHPSFTLDVIKPAEAWNIIWNTSMKAIERGRAFRMTCIHFSKNARPSELHAS